MTKSKAKAKVEVVAPKPQNKGKGKTEWLHTVAMRYAEQRTARQNAVSKANKPTQKF